VTGRERGIGIGTVVLKLTLDGRLCSTTSYLLVQTYIYIRSLHIGHDRGRGGECHWRIEKKDRGVLLPCDRVRSKKDLARCYDQWDRKAL